MSLQMDEATKHNILECMLRDASAEPTDLPLSLLKEITNDFSDNHEVGRGGFAVVYKGLLQNGTVAVKKLSQKLDVVEKNFHREVECLMRVKHKNIVRFLGYCGDRQMKMCNHEGKLVMAEVREWLLCFEFVPNGNLQRYITDASEGLEWSVRYQLIKGICEGLHYLHHQNKILHLDLKPANVLIDHNMVPKIADFGLSRCFDENQSYAITSKLRGTPGYMAPESFGGEIRLELDLYSLGVIIMEILTGRKGYSEIEDVLKSWSSRFGTSQGDTLLEQVRVCAEIGLQCIEPNPRKRRTTECILQKLVEMESRCNFVLNGISTSLVTHRERSTYYIYDTMEIVAGALPSLLPKLAELLKGEYNLQKEVKGGIIFLQAELESMKAALEEISKTPADKLNEQDKIWARKVRELSYDIEDKIDKFIVLYKAGNKVTEAEQHDFKKVIGGSLEWLTGPKIRRPNWLKRLSIRRKIAIDIGDIKRDQEVYERRCRYELNDNHTDAKPVNVDPRTLVRYEDVTKLVGINEARDEVIKILIQGHEVSKQQQDKIVSIVGFGGLGKTTLANVVYEKLKGEFDCWAFVSVSQTPDLEKIFNSLLYQLNKTYQERKNKVIGELSEPHWENRYEQLDKRNNASINDVIEELREFLQEKRYLIVIDDIWDISHWKHIRCALPPNTAGCKIITTTRNMEVAEEVGGAYKMKPLCIDSSQILFYGRIFGPEGKDKCPDEDLVEVSNKILTKCAGVPLAIITIAGLLAASKQRNKLEWYEVCRSIGTGMENTIDVVNMRNVLLLSYYSLPSPIRTCMLYLSMFPEDYEIDKRQLIWMWIAEGFILEKLGRSLFEVGESYFNELINRNLIQPVYYKDIFRKLDSMMVSSCRVHDVVLDVIHSLSREENFITTLNDSSQKIRRLSLQNGKLNEGAHGATVSMKQVRSVVAFSSSVHLIPDHSRFEVVRVLQLINCDLSHGYNLNYIGKLVHLRFLGLHKTNIDHLPEEIGNLQSLQVLDISGNAISTLPFTIVQLRQLKCLYIDGIISTGKRIWSLTSLEELSGLNIWIHNNAEDPIGTMQQLGHLTKLRVLYMNYFSMEHESMLAESLHKLQNLQHLSIHYYERTGRGSLEKWVGPQSLRSLSIDGYAFLKLPDWINHSHVQNLSFLKISVMKLQQEDLEILGRLPALCHLDMYFAKACYKDLCEFVISAGLFPCLLYFYFWGRSFDVVVFEKGAMPRLKRLEINVSSAVWSAWTQFPDMGFENLLSLEDLHVGLQHGKHDAVQARAALRNMARVHPNHPSISAIDYRF